MVGGLYYSYNADIVNPGTYRASTRSGGAPWGFLSSDVYANVSSASTTNKDVSYRGSIDGATYMDANISVSRSNLSIGSIKLTSGAYLNVDMVSANVPKTNSSYDQKSGYALGSYYYASANLITVKDEDYNYTVDYRDNLNLTMLFSDYLQVMKFPMNVGDTWSKSTHIDVEGNITGHLDVSGLSAEMNSSLMNALDLVHVSSLPINFAQVYGSNTTRFNNGTISIQTIINPSFKCVKAYMVDDAIAGKVVAFQIAPISQANPTESAYLRNSFSLDYLPSSGRISAITSTTSSILV